jgi:Protein of unknown function (DUF433)
VADLIEAEIRTRMLEELAEKVEFATMAALIKGTDIEVHRIAALLEGGVAVDDILADYPSLTRDAIDTAKLYADAHPKPRRPYPRNTTKRALRGAGLEALDEVSGDGDASE